MKAEVITFNEVNAAADAVIAEPDTGEYQIGGSYLLDLRWAIDAHRPSRAAFSDLDRPKKFRRKMARTAILLAQPKKL